jgi:coenzyme F420-reducing hydrogenase delta subunit
MKKLFLLLTLVALSCAGSANAQFSGMGVPNGGTYVPGLKKLECNYSSGNTSCSSSDGKFVCTLGATAICTVRTEFYGLMAAALVAAVAAVKHPRQLLEAAGEAARNVSCHFHIL